MVKLTIKRGNDSLFLIERPTSTTINDLTDHVHAIFDGFLRIRRLCDAVGLLADHGIFMPPEMHGLTDDQIIELKLKDEFSPPIGNCTPSGGVRENPDPQGLRTGKAPTENLAEVMRRTISEAKAIIDKDQIKANVELTRDLLKEAEDKIRGAVMIVYPMGIPPYDEVRQILENNEQLDGRAVSKELIGVQELQLWWAGKEFLRGKLLSDFVGKNEKTKLMVKIQRKGQGAPVREPVVTPEEQKQMMAWSYRKQEQLKKLEENEDDDFLDRPWANSNNLKNRLQGTGGIGWKMR